MFCSCLPRFLYAAVLILVGMSLLLGGGHLLLLGGSIYYVLAGVAILASGILLAIGNRRAGVVYAGMLVSTFAWAIWEAGFDGWALAPRLIFFIVLGLGFLFPGLSPDSSDVVSRPRRSIDARTFSLWLLAAVAIGAVTHAWGPKDYPDPLYQAGVSDSVPEILRKPESAGVSQDGSEWRHYGNDPGGSRFSPLDQLTPENVGRLEVAWQAHVGRTKGVADGNLSATPLKIGQSVYVCTGYNDVLSLDAETGRENWRFDAGINAGDAPIPVCRGLAFTEVPGEADLCTKRIVSNTTDARLIALDARTGRLCQEFGENGQVDLTVGMGEVTKGYYFVTSAPTIVHDKIVVGGGVSDGQYWGEPSGVIRAFDAVTGELAWAFDIGRPDSHKLPPPGETYTHSTPNSWAPMGADPELGLVYAPIGNSAADYYGAQRRDFDDKYSSSVIAIDVDTGRLRWSFQTVHHDLWDYDVASQPTLADISTPNGIQKALIQPTKRGEIFLLDRQTGAPLSTVEERPAATEGGAPAERLAATQPFSVALPSFGGARWRERDMWGLTPFDQLWCRIKFRQSRYEGTLTPPGLTPSISDPGFMGGIDWGGISVDRDRDLMIVNTNRMGTYVKLLPRSEADALGIRPSTDGTTGFIGAQANTPYAVLAGPFMSPIGAPCNEPPYGRVAAVDLRSRKLLWTHRLGTARDSGPLGISSRLPIPMGVPNTGGSLVTRGGLIFIGATQERALRALDVRSGKIIWKARLPSGGQATPMTYWSEESQRQFVLIAAGGNRYLNSKPGDQIIAYALPKHQEAGIGPP